MFVTLIRVLGLVRMIHDRFIKHHLFGVVVVVLFFEAIYSQIYYNNWSISLTYLSLTSSAFCICHKSIISDIAIHCLCIRISDYIQRHIWKFLRKILVLFFHRHPGKLFKCFVNFQLSRDQNYTVAKTNGFDLFYPLLNATWQIGFCGTHEAQMLKSNSGCTVDYIWLVSRLVS